jgi:secondary thiamine-phosphate synthase enzyme
MRQISTSLHIRTDGQGLYNITNPTLEWVSAQHMTTALLTLWCQHTSASLLVQENTDPDVQADLLTAFRGMAPENAGYRHSTEGPDDMPAHIRTALTQVNLSIPVENGVPVLGTWQAIYLFEHRDASQTRRVVLHLLGD